ncbi:MAG: hypothetical protein WCI22_05050, partial [Actinomycetota bacterium]
SQHLARLAHELVVHRADRTPLGLPVTAIDRNLYRGSILPTSFDDLLSAPNTAVFVTLGPDGAPHASPSPSP